MTAFFFIFLFDYYVNMDVKLLPNKNIEGHNDKLSQKASIFSFGSFIYKNIPILQFKIGEQYLIITLFLIFNQPLYLLYFVSTLGVFYAFYWPILVLAGKKS